MLSISPVSVRWESEFLEMTLSPTEDPALRLGSSSEMEVGQDGLVDVRRDFQSVQEDGGTRELDRRRWGWGAPGWGGSWVSGGGGIWWEGQCCAVGCSG